MMVNCPRCGFSQPEDQYCARCGVDMLNFQPARKPFLRRLAGSTVFQLFVLAVTITIVFSYARQQRQRELAERLAEIESAHSTQTVNRRLAENPSSSEQTRTIASRPPETQTESRSSSEGNEPASEAPSTNDVVRTGESAATLAAPPTAAETPEEDEATVNAAPDAMTATTTTTSATVVPPQSARVTFAAVSRRAINELIATIASADPNSTTSIGPVTVSVIPRAANRLRALQTTEYWEMLDSSTRSVQIGQPVEFYGGQREVATGQFVGFVIELTPSDYDETSTQVHLRILRYLREGADIEAFVVPTPETISIPRSGGAFITGALFGKRANTREERQFYDPIKVLRILSSEPYRNNLTDLLIAIEPQ